MKMIMESEDGKGLQKTSNMCSYHHPLFVDGGEEERKPTDNQQTTRGDREICDGTFLPNQNIDYGK